MNIKNNKDKSNNFSSKAGYFLILFIGFIAVPTMVGLFLQKRYQLSELTCTTIGNSIFFLVLLGINFNMLKTYMKDYKSNFKDYTKICLKYWSIGLAIMFISNLIINVIIFHGKIATNEALVREQLFEHPYINFISIAFIAPIVEELIFRIEFKKLFGNHDKIFIIFSGLFFGFMHTASGLSLAELIYIIPYGALGIAFASGYVKTKNICAPIIMHIIHNTITFLLLLSASSAL